MDESVSVANETQTVESISENDDEIAIDSSNQASDDVASGEKTFDELQTAIDSTSVGNTLYLNNTVYKADSSSSTLNITKNMTINGASSNGVGNSTLDGSKLIQMTANTMLKLLVLMVIH